MANEQKIRTMLKFMDELRALGAQPPEAYDVIVIMLAQDILEKEVECSTQQLSSSSPV